MLVDIDELFEEFSSIPQVEAIALGGSRKLKESIISNNMKLLNGMLPSFDM